MIDLLAIEVFGLSGGPLAALTLLTISVLLLVYAGISGARRRRALERLMPGYGFQPIEIPDPAALIPDELFYPNGFAMPSFLKQGEALVKALSTEPRYA